MCRKPLDRVYTDLADPIRQPSLGRARYFVTFLDSCSGFSLVKFLHRKRGAAETVIKMVQEVENLFHSRMKRRTTINRNMVKSLRSDEAREYVGSDFHKWLKNRGVVHQVTTAYSPKSNVKVEPLNRALRDMARRTMLSTKVCRNELLAEATATDASHRIGCNQKVVVNHVLLMK